ncbi:carboxyltransferase domain-containing protein, partial [Providencia rettgeri]
MRFLPVNLSAFMVELDSLEQTMALTDSLTEIPIHGVEEIIPAARTILVRYNPFIAEEDNLVKLISLRDITKAKAHA